MNQQESLKFLQQCMDEIKNWMPEDKERAKQLFEKMNLENNKNQDLKIHPMDILNSFYQMEKQHYMKNIEK